MALAKCQLVPGEHRGYAIVSPFGAYYVEPIVIHPRSLLSLVAIICGLVAAWYFTDLVSESAFKSILAPLLVAVFLISLMLWLVMLFHRRGIDQNARPGSTGIDFFSDGGDGGGE